MHSRPRSLSEATPIQSNFGESTLIEELLNGNPMAYEALVRKHRGRLFGVCYQILSDTGEAEDVVQETFIKAWTNLERFEGRSRIGTWLYRIAINLAKNRCRYLARRKTADLCGRDDQLDPIVNRPDPGPGPLAIMEGHRMVDHMDTLLESIEPEYRLLIELRQIQELPYTEIVHRTGLPIGTVKSRLHRARMALKAAYEAFLMRSQAGLGSVM